MNHLVVASVLTYHKIRRGVVRTNSIRMVNLYALGETLAQCSFRYQNVLKYVAIPICSWVFRAVNIDITLSGHWASTSPPIAVLTPTVVATDEPPCITAHVAFSLVAALNNCGFSPTPTAA